MAVSGIDVEKTVWSRIEQYLESGEDLPSKELILSIIDLAGDLDVHEVEHSEAGGGEFLIPWDFGIPEPGDARDLIEIYGAGIDEERIESILEGDAVTDEELTQIRVNWCEDTLAEGCDLPCWAILTVNGPRSRRAYIPEIISGFSSMGVYREILGIYGSESEALDRMKERGVIDVEQVRRIKGPAPKPGRSGIELGPW